MDEKRVFATEAHSYTPLPREPGAIRLVKISTELGHIAETYPRERWKYLRDESRPEDIFVCSMDAFAPANIPAYDALSYTWGNPLGIFDDEEDEKQTNETFSKQYSIICNGKVMEVGRNLYDALKLLWGGQKSGGGMEEIESGLRLAEYIWIDAICIDQNNVSERNDQVKLMDQIYRGAEKCIIWLGDEESSLPRAVKVIDTIGRSPSLIENASKFASSQRLESRDYSGEGLPAFRTADWLSVFLLYSRSWFQRMWILQEAILAKKAYVFCGSYYFQWHFLAITAQFLSRSRWASDIIEVAKNYFNFETNKSLFNTAAYISETRCMLGLPSYLYTSGETPSPKILSFLQDFRSANCKEPKDKIYAVRGILMGTPRSDVMNKITVDYSLPDWQIFLETAWAILETEGNLNLLSHAGMSGSSGVQGLPSWVPDWSLKEPSAVIRGRVFDDSNGVTFQWNASAGLHWKSQAIHGLPQTLFVQGKCVGEVTDVISFGKLGDIVGLSRLARVLHRVPKLYSPVSNGLKPTGIASDPDASANSKSRASRETRFEALWRTMAMDSWEGRSPAPQELGHHFTKALVYAHMFMVLAEGFIVGEHKRAQSWEVLKELSLDEKECITAYQSTLSAAPIGERDSYGEDFCANGPTKYLPLFTGSMTSGNWDDFREDITKDINESFSIWRYTQSSKPIIVSNTGLLSLGPAASSESDELWVLAGTTVPFVLRKGMNSTYKVIGEAYIHGLMNGEAITSPVDLEEIILV